MTQVLGQNTTGGKPKMPANKDKNFVVIDDVMLGKITSLKQAVKEECDDFMTHNALLHHIFDHVDENSFLEWIDQLKKVHKKGESLNVQSKQRFLKILKGGK